MKELPLPASLLLPVLHAGNAQNITTEVNATRYNWRRKLSSHPDWYYNRSQ